jgi:ferredoxin
MSVEITFQPMGIGGLIAEGTSLIDAGKRMGINVSSACRATPDCTACVISIVSGHSLLSNPTEHELKTLGQGKLVLDRRLACQTIVERSGELVVEIIPEEKQKDVHDVRATFSELPLDKKLVTLIQLEALMMSEAFDTVVDKTLSFGGKVASIFSSRGKSSKTGSGEGKSQASSSTEKR